LSSSPVSPVERPLPSLAAPRVLALDRLALRMLVGDRLKYLGLVAGLFFASLLVLQQASIFTGYTGRMASWVHDVQGHDLWVTDPQMDFTEDPKHLLPTALGRVRSVDGVAWAVPMYKNYLKARLADGTQFNVRVIGLDDASMAGGPREMVEGTLEVLRRDKAVLVNADMLDGQMRMRTGLAGEGPRGMRIGDAFSINDHEVRVAGTYRATPEFFWEPVVYTTFSRAVAISPAERRQTTYILASVADGVPVDEVKRRIAEATGLRAMTSDEFADRTTEYIMTQTGILINFGITIGMGFVIGVLVAGQTLYTFVLDNLRYFAALKAMGITNARIVRMVSVQVLAVGTIGFGIGLGLAAATGWAAEGGPLAFRLDWRVAAFGATAIMTCCLVSAWISLRRVMRLEPGMVFK
jgi:putative ABC transport system permease protein